MIRTNIRIVRKGDPPPFPEVTRKKVHELELNRFTVLQGGMASGASSVGFLLDLPDGSVGFVQTSAKIFEGLAAAVRGACQSWGEDNT